VAQPIPPQAPTAAASSRGARRGGERGKAPLRISTPDESKVEIVEEESDEAIWHDSVAPGSPLTQ
jgi:hypothetical protein